MDFQSYQACFDEILQSTAPAAPYDNPDYFNYTKLNATRMNRWLKHGVLTEDFKTIISGIKAPQQWIVITEPWCGDAAHIVPFLQMAAALNPLITISYELRDTEPFRINDYLTNGGKAIPKLIMQSGQGKELANWGPRPAECQQLYHRLMSEKAGFETVKTALQQWYNANEGRMIQDELGAILKALN